MDRQRDQKEEEEHRQQHPQQQRGGDVGAGASQLEGTWKLLLRKSDRISPVLKILGAPWVMRNAADLMGEVRCTRFALQVNE